MMREKKKSGSVVRRIMLSYVMISAAAVLINLVLYVNSFESAYRSLLQPHKDSAALLKQEMDYEMDACFTQISTLAKSTEVKELLEVQLNDYYERDDALIQKETYDLMGTALEASGLYTDLLLYDVSQQALLIRSVEPRGTQGRTNDTKHGEASLACLEESYGLSGTEISRLEESRTPSFVVAETENGTALIYTRNIYLNSHYSMPRGMLFGVIYLNDLMEQLTAYTDEENSVIMYTADGSFADDREVLSEKLDRISAEETTRIRRGFHEYIATRISSHCQDLNIWFVTNDKAVSKQMIRMLVITLIDVLGILLMALIFGRYFTRVNTQPLYEIMQAVDPETKEALTYENLNRQVNRVVTSAKQYESLYRDSFLSLLLYGQITDDEKINQYAEQNIMPAESYQLLLIRFSEKNMPADSKRKNLLLFVIHNVFSEVMQPILAAPSVASYSGVYFILKYVPEEEFDRLIQRGRDFLKQYLEEEVYAGLSARFMAMATLPIAKYQADEAANAAETSGRIKEVMDYHAVSAEMQSSAENGKIRSMMKKILSNNYEEALTLDSQLWQEYLDNGVQNGRFWHIQLTSMINLLYTDYKTLNPGFSVQSVLDMSVPELHSLIRSMMTELMDRKSGDTEARKVFEVITAYIRKNYTEPNLGVSQICEEFKLSYSYISNIFKRETGETVMDYINRVRIEEAKKMMEAGKTVTETSEILGYLEPRGFIRVFKKYEGITPGQYKKQ